MPLCSSHLLWPVMQVQSWRPDLDLVLGTLWGLQGVKETTHPEVSSLIPFIGTALSAHIGRRIHDSMLAPGKLLQGLVIAAARLPPQVSSLPFVTVTSLEWPSSLRGALQLPYLCPDTVPPAAPLTSCSSTPTSSDAATLSLRCQAAMSQGCPMAYMEEESRFSI